MQFTNGWLAFELGVLRRLKFTSVALAFTGEGEICVHLKSWKVRVATNDPMLWSFTKAFALVENNTEQLSEDDLNMLLDDAYVPREKLENRALLTPFSLPDVFRRLLDSLPAPQDNGMRNQSTNQDVRNFVAERHHTDLLFLRLPSPTTRAP